jgi:hypothetical protein
MTKKGLWAWAQGSIYSQPPRKRSRRLPFPLRPPPTTPPPLPIIIKENSRFDFLANFLRTPAAIGGGGAEMVAVAEEGPIRGVDTVQPALGEAARAAEAAKGGDAPSGKEEVREYASDMRKLEELLSKLNPSAEEFVPLSRRRRDGRGLSADAPVFVSPAIDYYAPPTPSSRSRCTCCNSWVPPLRAAAWAAGWTPVVTDPLMASRIDG